MRRPDGFRQTAVSPTGGTHIARATVIGAGVIGLTTALELAEDGWEVEVVTAEPVAATTSAVAAAMWFPYLVSQADMDRWGWQSAEQLARLAADADVPVAARTVHEFRRTAQMDPGWRAQLPDFTVLAELPGWATHGWTYTSWTADMSRYLGWLLGRLEAEHAVQPDHRRLASTDEAFTDGVDLVVNCTGADAATLVDDPALTAVRGQVVLVEAAGVTDAWLDPDGPGGATYVIPRIGAVVCGGTADHGQWDRTPDEGVTVDILNRAAELVPAVAGATVLDVAVGLRPSRPEVRLEVEETGAGPVLHNYGHGGAGVTLSWGAARAARDLARTAVD